MNIINLSKNLIISGSTLPILCTLLLFLTNTSFQVFGQVRTGEVNYENLGIKFNIPEGWKGQETGEGFIIGHDTRPGFIMLSTHSNNQIEQLRQLALAGFQDENGTNLTVSGGLAEYGDNGIGGEFYGTMQSQPVKFFIIAMTNPYGYGLMIMSGTDAQQYSNDYRLLAEKVAESVVFAKSESSTVVDQWKQQLTNKRLTYMDSYYSSGPSYDGYSTGGGYSTTIKIDLCNQGYFNYSGDSSLSVDTGGAFGSSGGNNRGNGTWEIIGNASGEATLVLRFNNGEVYEYELTMVDGKTMLNGKRYFVTDGSYNSEDGPHCW